MKTIYIVLILGIVLTLTAINPVFAIPSSEPTEKDKDRYDDWNVARTRPYGEDGYFQHISRQDFRPVIVFESLGGYQDIAYKIGEEFAAQYPNRQQCAEKIFCYVRDRVHYTSDIDIYNVEEFATNADELAQTIEKEGRTCGDCEDMAILLAVMFKGAGFRSAIVVVPGHAAAMVHFDPPGYKKANVDWAFKGESGWIWAEATGRNNPLGWTPEDLTSEEIWFYEISVEEPNLEEPPFSNTVHLEGESKASGAGGTFLPFSPFLSILFIMYLLSALSRRGKRSEGIHRRRG